MNDIFKSISGYTGLIFLVLAIVMMIIDEVSLKKPKHYESADEAYAKRPQNWILLILFGFALLCALTYVHFDLDMNYYLSNIGGNFGEGFKSIGMLFDLSHPTFWQIFFGFGEYEFTESVIYMIIKTFGIAYIGTFIASLIAIPFGLLASHKLFGKWAWISEIILIVIRTFPELVFAILLIRFSGYSFLSGVLVIGIHSIGMIGKLYADQIDGIEMGPLEGIYSGGASKWQAIHLAVMPQALPGLLSVALYRFDINIRTATILGVVLGLEGGIGYYLSIQSTHYHALGACIFGIVILVVGINLLSSYLRKKLV